MLKSRSLIEDAREIWNAGVQAVDAARLVRDFVDINEHSVQLGGQTIELATCRRLIVVGFGKASGAKLGSQVILVV